MAHIARTVTVGSSHDGLQLSSICVHMYRCELSLSSSVHVKLTLATPTFLAFSIVTNRNFNSIF